MKHSLLASLFFLILFSSVPNLGAHEGGPQSPLEADMVYIPAGPFVFGTDEVDETGKALEWGIPRPLYQDEHPQQEVFLKGFYIDRFEVTNRRYKAFIDEGYFPPPDWVEKNWPEGRADFPVVGVSWFDAANFCQYVGKQLPSEKQWEKAARGSKGRLYPWGDTFEIERANLSDVAGSRTTVTKVGSFPKGATPEGVQDMVGNVWEWIADDYKPYKGSTDDNPAYQQTLKVLRGQSVAWIGHFPGDAYLTLLKEFTRSGYRETANPDQGAPDVGFRCVSLTAPKGFGETPAPAGGETTAASTKNNSLFNKDSGDSGPSLSSTDSSSDSAGFNPFEPQSSLPTQSGMLVLVLLSFIAGLFSFLSPCTLPILPAYFAITAQADRTRMTLLSFAFFCGLASLFVLMGASASFLGGVLRDYLRELTMIGGVLVVIFGVMTFFGKGFSGATFKSQPNSTLFGYFLFGATFAMGWTPCVGPVLSGILVLAASERTIFQGMALLFFFAVGLGLPLIIIAAFCSHLKKDSLFWRALRGKGWTLNLAGRPMLFHTTNMFSGLLLVVLGGALAQGYLTMFNSMIPIEIQIWFSGVEEAVVHWFT